MQTKILFILLLCLGLSMNSYGQLRKIIHATFDLQERDTLRINVYGNHTVVPWSGDNIMTETTVKLYGASAGILNHFIEAGRYELELQDTMGFLNLISLDIERKPIKTRSGEYHEEVEMRVFLPDSFSDTGGNMWIRTGLKQDQITKDN